MVCVGGDLKDHLILSYEIKKWQTCCFVCRACVIIEGFPEVMEHLSSPCSLQSQDFCICSHQSKPVGALTNWTGCTKPLPFRGGHIRGTTAWRCHCEEQIWASLFSVAVKWKVGAPRRQVSTAALWAGDCSAAGNQGWFKCEENQDTPPRDVALPSLSQSLWYEGKSKMLLTFFSRQLM